MLQTMLLSILLSLLSQSRLGHAKNECQPLSWGKRDLDAASEQRKLPPIPNQSEKFGKGGPKAGDLVCRMYYPTDSEVNYFTCAELAYRTEISNDEFFFINPDLKPDCSNIKPYSWYCVDGFIEPLRAYDGKCGPPNKNATCLGTGTSLGCCNSKTWTCGDGYDDCAPGICYEGECPGHQVYSTDGKCGPSNGMRGCGGEWGDCCNLNGQCGFGNDFCKADVCVFGNCTATGRGPPSLGGDLPWTVGNTTDGTCGPKNGLTCGVVSGNCCNKDGLCGSLPSDCGQGCQPLYGKCNDKKPPLSTVVFDSFDGKLDKKWVIADGTFEARSGKLVMVDPEGGKAFYDTSFDNFILEADVALNMKVHGNAGLIFRATELGNGADAYHGYYVGISTDGWVELGRADGGWKSITWTKMTITASQIYHIKVQAIGDLINIFVDDMTSPKLSIRDATYARGAAGVRSFWAGATVDNFAVSTAFVDDFGSDLSSWKTYDGKFEATRSGMIASDLWSGKAIYVATFQDFVLEADIALSKAGEGNAGLIFRATGLGEGADAYNGYYAGIGTDGNVVLGRADGSWRYLTSAKADIIANQVVAMKVRAVGDLIEVYVDDTDKPKISFRDSTYTTGSAGVRVFGTGARLNSFKIQPVSLDKFDNKNLLGWKVIDGEFKVESGELVASDAWSGKASFGTTVKDFILEVDVTITKDSGNAGLNFRTSDLNAGPDSYNGYYAGLDHSGWCVLGRSSSGTWAELQAKKTSVTVNKKNHIKVKAIGGQIQMFVDDMINPKLNVKDDKFQTGAIGVRVYSASAKFDNFMIQSL